MDNKSFNKLIAAWLLIAVAIIWAAPTVFAMGEGYGPGRVGLQILAGRDHVAVGSGGIWNSRDQLHIQLEPEDGWRIQSYKIDLGGGEDYSPPLTTTGNPKIGHFDFKEEFNSPYDHVVDGCTVLRRTFILDLEEDMAFHWGAPWAEQRLQGVAIFMDLVKIDADGNVTERTGAWVVPELITWIVETEEDSLTVVGQDVVADVITGEIIDKGVIQITDVKKGQVAKKGHQRAQRSWEVEEAEDIVAFDGGRWGWWFRFELGHPLSGHFVDSPVAGLSIETPTFEGVTDINASFHYFPDELVEVSLGSILLGTTVADKKISPLDLFDPADIDDNRVINLARLLQSFDADGDPDGGIVITPETVGAFESAMASRGLTEIDFSDDVLVEDIIVHTIDNAALLDPPVLLVMQSAEDAKTHLDKTMNNYMFRKKVSRTPNLASSKAKMNISTVWQPALPPYATAETEAVTHKYMDESGDEIAANTEAKPIVVVFTDENEETGAHDVWAAVSRDDGNTFKRKNISRAADRTSYTKENGEVVYGHVKKPVFQVKGNKILVAWSSLYARGGRPRFAIKTDDEYTHDDVYAVDDYWGVSGPQRSHDYTEDGYPEVGEVPYRALWVCRGVIATAADVDKGVGQFPGDIVWFKPERLTSGRRDVNQIFCGAASGAGFGVIWQEDPEGVAPGKAHGPGEGWSGATTNHKTDIWYSYITWADHTKVDTNFEAGGDPEHDLDVITRPKALVPMSLPVRISDNDVLNRRNMGLDDSVDAEDVSFSPENLTRCVKYEGGKSIVSPDDPEAYAADYPVLRLPPEDHYPSMNCTNCHPPWGTEPHNEDAPTQGSPIPLVVLDAETMDYRGGYDNGDCVSCHYSYIVPKDRVIAMTPGLDEGTKCTECETKGGIWKPELEAYYPYEGYPYIYEDDAVNDGTHRYGQEVAGLLSDEYYTFINNQGNERSVAITTDGRLLDGDTGASRPNLFMQTYTDVDGKTSAWAIITYEETKGVKAGGPSPADDDHTTGDGSDKYVAEEGKNAIFHSFDFKNPDLVAGGDIVNPPEMDDNGNPLYVMDELGSPILDFRGRPQLAYENARRGRFIIQGRGAIKTSRTIMAMVYKMGEEGHGRPSDIFLSRWVVPTTDNPKADNPYRFDNMVGDRVYDPQSEKTYMGSGFKNMSSVTPVITTDSMGDPTTDDPYGAVKVVSWAQSAQNLNDRSKANPYDDARAHRGQIRGDFLVMGFTYCDNWAAFGNGNDKYDLFVRRSFDGGQTWSTDPAGPGVEHGNTWTYPSGTDSAGTKFEEVNFYEAGAFESMRNLSHMKNNKETVIEPRIVGAPGTIKAGGVWTGKPEDKQNQNVFYVTYGTATNEKKDPVTKEKPQSVPVDLYYSFSRNKGNSYHLESWVVNPDSDGNNAGETVYRWGRLAKGEAQQGEAQIRMTPDGSRFYSCWLDDGTEGSDIVFRRIMDGEFPQNIAVTGDVETDAEPVDELSSSDDFSSDSGGSED